MAQHADDRRPGTVRILDSYNFGPQRRGVLTRTFSAAGVVGAECRNENFAPVLHRRAVALISGRALLVLDLVEGARAASKLQRWFHLDSERVGWDEGGLLARSSDEGKPNVAIHAAYGTLGAVEPGMVSDLIDISRPSRRVCLTTAAAGSQLLVAIAKAPGVPRRSRAVSVAGRSS